jgi:hypothetical protein
MRAAIHPLPQYAFMEWRSIKNKAQRQIYLYLLQFPYEFTTLMFTELAKETGKVVFSDEATFHKSEL